MSNFLDLLTAHGSFSREIDLAAVAIDVAEKLDASQREIVIRALKAISENALRDRDLIEVEMLAMIAPDQRGYFRPDYYLGAAKKKAAALLKQPAKPATSKRGK